MFNLFKKKNQPTNTTTPHAPAVNLNPNPGKVLILIMDGLGISSEIEGNAFAKANTPNFDLLLSQFPTTVVEASGFSVGLPWGEIGNSEVGHLTIGSGQIINQNLPRINQSIKDGTFANNKILVDAVENCKRNNSDFHLMGLYGSSGVVHSDPKHLHAILEMLKEKGLKNVYLHLFTDGRDSPPKAGAEFLAKFNDFSNKLGIGKIASLSGRKFAMDRNSNYKLIEETYRVMTQPMPDKSITDPSAHLQQQYTENVTDEFIQPVQVVGTDSQPVGLVKPNDSMIFFNYRADRAVQITKAFCLDEFTEFERQKLPIHFSTMIEYEDGLPVNLLFEPQLIKDCISKVVSDNNLKVMKVAETEKYAHVTYFFNGGIEEPFQNEEHVLIPSRNESFDKIPEMQANDIAKKLIEAMNNQQHHLIVANFANPDMVGHTGNLQAAIKAMEIVDTALGAVIQAAFQNNYVTLISSDHGNCEEMVDPFKGVATTTHTGNPVFFIDVNPEKRMGAHVLPTQEILYTLARQQPDNFLIDIAPAALNYLQLPAAQEMTGVVASTVSSMLSRTI